MSEFYPSDVPSETIVQEMYECQISENFEQISDRIQYADCVNPIGGVSISVVSGDGRWREFILAQEKHGFRFKASMEEDGQRLHEYFRFADIHVEDGELHDISIAHANQSNDHLGKLAATHMLKIYTDTMLEELKSRQAKARTAA